MIFGKNYKDLEFEDIERLVSNKISESRTLDYKRDLNIDEPKKKKEFLFDITSFANTDGGVIIYGISELKDGEDNTGLPDKICGIYIADNEDKLKQRIEGLIGTSIEPNIPNITIKLLEKDGLKILIIGIPKAMGLPRMVTLNKTNKFYKRRNSGNYLVDVFELNQMFMEGYELLKELDGFREKRLKEIKSGNFLPHLDSSNMVLVHIYPMNYFRYNLISLSDNNVFDILKNKLRPIGDRGYDYLYNFEGMLIYSGNPQIYSYNEVFRNGVIECFSNIFHAQNEGENILYLPDMECSIIKIVKSALEVYKELSIAPAFAIQITVCGLFNRRIYSPHRYRFGKNELVIPSVVINDFDANIGLQLKYAFDTIWQSAGCRESPCIDDDGKHSMEKK